MPQMHFRNLLALIVVTAFATPSLGQFDPYKNLAFVPRQGQLNQVLTTVGNQLFLPQGREQALSVNDLARAYKDTVGVICGNNPDGEIVNWFGKVHSIVNSGDNVKVELIVAERASVIALLPAGSDLLEPLKAASGRWIHIDGSFVPDDSCLLQVPPLTAAAMLKPQYLAKLTGIRDTVTATEIEQLESALPKEAWL